MPTGGERASTAGGSPYIFRSYARLLAVLGSCLGPHTISNQDTMPSSTTSTFGRGHAVHAPDPLAGDRFAAHPAPDQLGE